MVNGLPHIRVNDEVCEGCIFRKQHRESFSNKTWKARECLAFLHSYLCGLMETMYFGKACYFLTLVDDYSKKT